MNSTPGAPGTAADRADGAAGAAGAPPPRRQIRLVPVIVIAAVATIAVAAVLVVFGRPSSGHPGHPAARSFSLPQLGEPGHRVSLTQYAGRPVIVNFFASWCKPCQQETPALAAFYKAHHGALAVIGIDSNDQSAAALAFMKAKGVGYPVGFDPLPASTTSAYGVSALPQTFLLNASHQIVKHIVGPVTQRELNAWAADPGGS